MRGKVYLVLTPSQQLILMHKIALDSFKNLSTVSNILRLLITESLSIRMMFPEQNDYIVAYEIDQLNSWFSLKGMT